METDLALLIRLIMLGKVDVNRLGTTTLSVLDSGSGGAARSNLLALRPILHVVVQLEVHVVFNRYINVCDRETRLSLVTAERSWFLLADFVLNALRAKGAASQYVAFAEGVRALPATREIEVTVVEVGIAILEVRPIEPSLLLVTTLIVVVVGRVEWVAEHVPSRSGVTH